MAACGHSVIPAKAVIHTAVEVAKSLWIPAYAGLTRVVVVDNSCEAQSSDPRAGVQLFDGGQTQHSQADNDETAVRIVLVASR